MEEARRELPANGKDRGSFGILPKGTSGLGPVSNRDTIGTRYLLIASGCQGSNHCSVMNCVFSFNSFHFGDPFTGGRILLWASGEQTLLGNELSMQFLGQCITGIGFTGFGFHLWGSGEQTLLSNELRMQFLG